MTDETAKAEEKKEAEKKYQEHVQKILKERNFKVVDDLRYSLEFKDLLFTFHIPSLLEKTKIKSIMSQIAFIPGSRGVFSSTIEIEGSGDVDLISSTKLLTHMSVLLDKIPDGFDLEALAEEDQFNLGYAIMLAEREFIERKKKASPTVQ